MRISRPAHGARVQGHPPWASQLALLGAACVITAQLEHALQLQGRSVFKLFIFIFSHFGHFCVSISVCVPVPVAARARGTRSIWDSGGMPVEASLSLEARMCEIYGIAWFAPTPAPSLQLTNGAERQRGTQKQMVEAEASKSRVKPQKHLGQRQGKQVLGGQG